MLRSDTRNMSSRKAEFRSIGGQTVFVRSKALSKSGSLPSLGNGRSPTGSTAATHAQNVQLPKQRGIMSEVVRAHGKEEIECCQLGPNADIEMSTCANSLRKSASAAKFSLSRSMRDKVGAALPVAKDSSTTEVLPKVIDVYEHRPGDKPRKVVVERRKRKFEKLDIEQLLVERGITFRPPNWKDNQWLDLNDFDNTEYDIRSPDQWVELGNQEDGSFLPLEATGLRIDDEGAGFWQDCLIHGYDKEKKTFQAAFEDQKEKSEIDHTPPRFSELTRLQILFRGEDPILFADRIQFAFQTLHRAQARAKLNFFIDYMPIEDIQSLDVDQIARILELAKNSVALKDVAIEPAANDLIREANLDFARTMNKIILANEPQVQQKPDDNVDNSDGEVQETGLGGSIFNGIDLDDLEEDGEHAFDRQAPWFALWPVPEYNFTHMFSSFCFASLYIKQEVVGTLCSIMRENLNQMSQCMYAIQYPKVMKVDQFRQLQRTTIAQMAQRIKDSWVGKLKKIIIHNFNNVGKGWFSIHETNPDTYRQGKMKKLLAVIRFMMQEALRFFALDSVADYCYGIERYCPETVDVQSLHEINSTFVTPARPSPATWGSSLDLDPPGRNELTNESCFVGSAATKDGLFIMDIKATEEKDNFVYTYESQAVIEMCTEALEQGLQSLSDVPQLESSIVPQLFKTSVHKQVLNVLDTVDDKWLQKWVDQRRVQMEDVVRRTLPALGDFLKLFDPYKNLLAMDPVKYVEEKTAAEISTEEAKQCILEHLAKETEVLEAFPDTVVVGLFEVSCGEIRKMLANKHRKIVELLIQMLGARFREWSEDISTQFQSMFSQLRKPVKDIEEISAMRDFIGTVPAENAKLAPDMKKCLDTYTTLEGFDVKMTNDDAFMRWRVFGCPKQAHELTEQIAEDLKEKEGKFLQEMVDEQTEFDENLVDLAGIIGGFASKSDLAKVEEIYEDVESVNQRLREAAQQSKKFNSREVLFGKESTDYSSLTALQKEWEPFSQLWVTAHHWISDSKEWISGEFSKIDAKYCENAIMNGVKALFKAVKALEKRDDADGVLRIARDIKEQMDNFVPNVPIIVGLRNKGMRERHWEEVSKLVGEKIDPEMADFTLQKFLDVGMLPVAQDIQEIGDKSGKELGIENQLRQMQTDWDEVAFDCAEPYRSTETYILKGVDEVMAKLDEQVVLTQAMQFSPFNKPFKDEIDEWNDKLAYMSESLDQWLKVQRNWMYLQPIFDSDDIMKQLPTEGKKFNGVNKRWRQVMGRVHNNPHALTQCTAEGVLEIWTQANKDLDAVQKGLDDYLETKRGAFARFYFLSNDELLEILSQTKDPLRVQPFLSKVFEAMKQLTFTSDLVATQMYSMEGEIIDFVNPVVTSGKNVEDWMTEVENQMLASIRNVVKIGVETYLDMLRTDWVLKSEGQVCLNSSQVHWTAEVEEAIQAGTLDEYFQKLSGQLLDLVFLVRGNITKLQRKSIGALVVIDVHAKDTVEMMSKEKVSDLKQFEWISQLRYYWKVDDRNTEHLWVQMVQTWFPYGYEYLGNSFRLVITQLTDMCYMTLMGAQSLNLGGAPAGPAGTGKTETTKDLAKALAKQCVVFNCSPEMDYLMVGKFFKGLASSGAWCCFDEFNRINIEVLSVIAQQLLQLFSAKRSLASYNEQTELEFDGTLIVMKPTFNVFITMNPGYAGRSELPDNLAALFRPMAMMVPDYGMIGEISFYAFGFEKGRHLAKKMVTTFQLCSEQLSAQCHYDYGMRAVKTVIEAAGLNKRKFPDQSEAQILLRALRDVNVPKFLRDDLPLFDNIISDLFPGVDRPQLDYGLLGQSCIDCSKARHLQPTDYFIKKQFELFDMIQVRHGMMLVGPTGGGKTCCCRTLQAACSEMVDPQNADSPYQKTHVHVLNPKAITQNQLYGSFDEVTREWSDGVAAELIRNAVRDNVNPDHHWIMFDGPVDALWIESMNTVLDDNKKLCLVSGEIIALTSKMRMQFEVEDLEVASPATVSRCGMIYMEPESLGFDPFFESWLEQLPETFKFKPDYQKQLLQLCQDIVPPTLAFLRKACSECVKTQDNNLIQALFRLLDCYFDDYKPNELRPAASFKEAIAELGKSLAPLFFFCLVWSLGGTTNNVGRVEFSKYIWGMVSRQHHHEVKRKMEEIHVPVPPFQEGVQFDGIETGAMMYDYFYSIEKRTWIPWLETVPKFEVPRNSAYESIVVPSVDSIRVVYIFQLLVLHDKHVLCPGPTGTGKSVNIGLWLNKQAPDNFQGTFINFSAQTHVNQLQDLIDGKIEKRRRGVYGPPSGKKMVLFIDDLNMPLKEYYGAQPPIELIRQWHDHGGWFNRKELVKFDIIDVIMVSAMGPPGGGRTFITERLKRHYSTTAYTDLQEDSIKQIFKTITAYFFATFDESVLKLTPSLIEATIKIFNRALEDLLPTPSKSHYLFNLRDIWKVFLGNCSLSVKNSNNALTVGRCWCHEIQRVFGDRLTDQGDISWLKDQLERAIVNNFGMDVEEVFARERLVFASFMTTEIDNRIYEEIADVKAMKEQIEQYLEDYNSVNDITMPLVMFLDACEHCARSCRVLEQPNGNVLLLGVGGSGRQSLTRLSSFICEARCYQIEVAKGYGMAEFKEDLKKCLMSCGVEDKVQVFLFCDTQIVKEDFVEAINNVLNSGDVPNLYAIEDFEAISTSCRSLCQSLGMQPTKANLFSAYLIRVKKNVHVVLAFSPVGDSFRNRLRNFPSLVNCCTIDWFHPWPAEALYSVAKQQLTGQSVVLPNLEGSLNMFQTMHISIETFSKKFLERTNRNVYITPTSYLELLSSFMTILANKRSQVGTQQQRYQVGLTKIGQAEAQVEGLKQMLIEKQPILEETQKKVGQQQIDIQKDKDDAEVVSKAVAKEEAEAQTQAQATQEIKDSAQKVLDAALPDLEIAVKCLEKLKIPQIQEARSFQTPPAGVKLCCEAVCIMFQMKPVKKADPSQPGKKIDDYWETSQKELLADPKLLLTKLINYDKDNIPDRVIQAVTPYMQNEDFTPANIKKASLACEAMCLWVGAMYKYHFVALEVAPKRELLKQKAIEYEECMANLAKAQQSLMEVEEKVARLEAELNQAIATQDELQRDMQMCTLKLERAHKLIAGLGGEKARWGQTVTDLTARMELLPGDCILAAGMVSYVGPFTSEIRQECETLWRKELTKQTLAHNSDCSMRAVLGEPVKIQQWVVASLPNDALSIENGIIIDRSRRWPLMIDPQRQANRYIKNMGKEVETGIDVCKLSEKSFLRKLELGIQFGKWILLENIGINLDPALEPVLQQQKIKDGSGFIIKLGDKSISYSDTFKFFMTTTLPNPHYSPETSVKVTLLNFAITPVGLEDQMLGIVVAKERPDLEEQKNELVVQNARNNKILQDIEDDILRLLATSEGDVLEDDTLVDKVTDSKKISNEINEKREIAVVTEANIDAARESYRPVAYRTAVLFFCIVELTNIDPMYQYSLQWFQLLFTKAVEEAPKSDVFEQRLEILKDFFTEALYQNICRGLFEKDKTLFSFALCVRIMKGDNQIDANELRYLLVGPTKDLVEGGPDIPASWVGQQRWNEILTLSTLAAFPNFAKYFAENIDKFKKIYDSVEADKEKLPNQWEKKITPMQRLCFIRAMRIDCLSSLVITFITNQIGQKFVEPPTFDIEKSFADSVSSSPLIFILSPGTDPVSDVIAFAEKVGMSKRFESISLGQGQGPKASSMIENAQQSGGWVLLSNCHLMESWMSSLEATVEQFNPDLMSKNFRLWLTSMPAKSFPVQVLQVGVKMTNEPPSGLRANLLRSYSSFSNKMFEQSNKPIVYKTLLFGFCFFHAVVQDRRKFGPIGWNIAYGFTPEDLQVCRQQLMTFVNQYEEVPYKVLNFLGARINYGGRVTDDKDKLLISTILKTYICPETINDPQNYKYSASGKYYPPQAETVEEFVEYIRTLPLLPMPEAFGLHDNCNITTAQNSANKLLINMQSMVSLGTGGGGGSDAEEVMDNTASGIQDRLPKPFALDVCELKFPTMYEESMNTVVKQECLRYNKLLWLMISSLKDFRKAIKGLIVMTSDLEEVGKSMFVNAVPEMWSKKGPLSLKPLSSWFLDIIARCQFFQMWCDLGKPPPVFWISGIFFPQAFFTGAMQNFARKYNEEIDLLSFKQTPMDDVKEPKKELVKSPEDGVYVYGLFLEGARWDPSLHRIVDSRPKELFTDLVPLWFLPVRNRIKNEFDYRCPTYKVLSRKGVLLTTGHSTNFVLYLELSTDKRVDKWIKAGMAAFLALAF